MRGKYGVHCAGGQGSMKGQMIRLNHMGYVDEVDTVGAIAAQNMREHLLMKGFRWPTLT